MELLNVELRLSCKTVYSIWRRGAELSGDPALGLHVVELVPSILMETAQHVTSYPLVQLLLASATVGDGLRSFSRYYALAEDGARYSLSADGHFHYRPDSLEVPASLLDFCVLSLLRFLQRAAVRLIVPRRVYFTHGPALVGEYERIFAVAPSFLEAENGFTLDADQLRTPLRTANPELRQRLETHMSELVSAHLALRTTAGRVRRLIETELPRSQPTADRVAAKLAISTRTLARRLSAEGTSFMQLLDEVRARLVKQYLRDDQLSLDVIAERLGFSESTAFIRAFKRWHGQTVTEYRRAAKKSGPAQ
jgi:AraC-like DNA-binding protein